MAVVDGFVVVSVRKTEGRPVKMGQKASWRSLVACLGIRTALIAAGSIPVIVVSETVLEGRISLMTA